MNNIWRDIDLSSFGHESDRNEFSQGICFTTPNDTYLSQITRAFDASETRRGPLVGTGGYMRSVSLL